MSFSGKRRLEKERQLHWAMLNAGMVHAGAAPINRAVNSQNAFVRPSIASAFGARLRSRASQSKRCTAGGGAKHDAGRVTSSQSGNRQRSRACHK